MKHILTRESFLDPEHYKEKPLTDKSFLNPSYEAPIPVSLLDITIDKIKSIKAPKKVKKVLNKKVNQKLSK